MRSRRNLMTSAAMFGVGALTAAFAAVPSASAAPRPFDLAGGTGTTSTGDTFDFSASKDATTDEWVHGYGEFNWADPAGTYTRVRASCVVVSGSVGIIGARVMRSDHPTFPKGSFITIKASDVPSADTLYVGTAIGDPCADPGAVGDSVATGSIVVTDR